MCPLLSSSVVGFEIAALAVEDLILVVGAVNVLVRASSGDEGQQGPDETQN
jgi:hypothetical protein